MTRPPGDALPDLQAARVVALGMVTSKPAGYLRDALLAARFGTGAAMDAFSLASSVALAAFDVIGTPLQRVLVPVLVEARSRRGGPGLAATAGAVFWAAVVAALVLGLGLCLAAGPVAQVLAGHGPAAARTAALLRWLSPLPLGLCLAAYATSWLQAAERFTLPAFVGLPYDLAIIGFILFAGRHGILAAAWGLVVGAFGQYGLQWFGLRRQGHRLVRPAPSLARDPGLVATARMAPPLLVSVGSVQAGNLLQAALAARLPTGSVAALGYALRVLDLPAALFMLPVTTVALPRFAALVAARRDPEAAGALAETAWILAAGLLPCALLLGLLARPVAAALYAHGAFSADSVTAMAAALAGLAPGVMTSGGQQLLRTYFFARQAVRTVMLWDIVALAVSAALEVGLGRIWGVFGLALGWSAGPAAAWLGLCLAARRTEPAASGPRLLSVLVGVGALVAVTLAVRGHIPPLLGDAPWRQGLTTVAGAGLLGSAAYVAGLLAAGGGPLLVQLVGAVRPRP